MQKVSSVVKRIVPVIVAVMLVVSLAGRSEAQSDKFKFRLGHVNAPGSMVFFAAEEFAKQAKDMSKGRIEIDVFANAVLGNEARLMELVNSGNLDLGITTAMGLGSYVPAVSVLEADYVFRDIKTQLAFALSDEGQKFFQPIAQKTNMMVVANHTFGLRHLTTKNKAIKTPADLKGMKIRCMDFRQAVENVTALGGAATPMAFSELYMGLRQGVVDGQENPLNTIIASKFYEVQKYLMLTGHVVTNSAFVMSKKSFDSLPKDLQAVILEAGKAMMKRTAAEIEKKEGDWMKELESKGMVVIKPDVDAFRKRAIEYLPAKMEDVWGKGAYEKIANFK